MKMKITLMYFLLLSIMIMGWLTPAMAQGKNKKRKTRNSQGQVDSLQAFREFINLGNEYKQLPLQLEMEIVNYESGTGMETDSLVTRASFYLQDRASYVRIGRQEQLANDSLLLQISDEAQRILVSRHTQTVASHLQKMMGSQLPDSGIQRLSNIYAAVVDRGTAGVDTLKLVSRIKIPEKGDAMEEMIMLYDNLQKRPLQVTTHRRDLLELEKETYDQWKADPVKSVSLVEREGKGAYVMRTSTVEYRFKHISHTPDFQLPVSVNDRIVLVDGGWMPVRGYEEYRITDRK